MKGYKHYPAKMIVTSYVLNEPPSLEFLCLQFIVSNLDRTESSHDDENSFVSAVCNLPGTMIRTILEFLGKSGLMSDFKLGKLFKSLKSNSIPMKRLHMYSIKEKISGVGLLHFSCYAFEEIILKFDKRNCSQPNIDELWNAFKGSEKSLEVLKLISYPLNSSEQGHVFNFAARFPNLKSFCIHTFLENCQISNVNWKYMLSSCQSLKEVEIFVPNNKGQMILDTALISHEGRNIKSLSFPALLSYSNIGNIGLGLNGLLTMNGLSHLDISVDDDPELSSAHVIGLERRTCIMDFMEQLADEHILPNLVSLDLSGLREVHSGHISKLLTSHSKIEFLGLCLLEVEYTNNNSVAGSVSVSSTISLIVYFCLNSLYRCTPI